MAFAARPAVFLTLLALLVLSPLAASFNVTEILAKYPDFSTFNSLLTQAYLVAAINSRNTITVLAVDNSAASAISSHPPQAMKSILSVHVVLDYYDVNKLHNISNRSAILTTLYQTTGFANGNTGFLNVTMSGNGDIAFGSAAPGSQLNSHFVKVLDTQPYDISVLHVSSAIVPPGIDQSSANHTAAPPPSPKSSAPPPSPKSPAPPTMAPDAAAPTGSNATAPPPASNTTAPPPASNTTAPPSKAPTASVESAPADAPSDATADAPSSEDDESSAADLVVAGAGVAFAVALAAFGSF